MLIVLAFIRSKLASSYFFYCGSVSFMIKLYGDSIFITSATTFKSKKGAIQEKKLTFNTIIKREHSVNVSSGETGVVLLLIMSREAIQSQY